MGNADADGTDEFGSNLVGKEAWRRSSQAATRYAAGRGNRQPEKRWDDKFDMLASGAVRKQGSEFVSLNPALELQLGTYVRALTLCLVPLLGHCRSLASSPTSLN